MTPGQAALGTAVFFFLAPGIVTGVIPWWISGWAVPNPLPLFGMPAVAGALLIAFGLRILVARAMSGTGDVQRARGCQHLLLRPKRFTRRLNPN